MRRALLLSLACVACAGPSMYERYRLDYQAELDGECLPGFTFGDARCPIRRRVQLELEANEGALSWASPAASVGPPCGVVESHVSCVRVADELPSQPAVRMMEATERWATGTRAVCGARGRRVECVVSSALWDGQVEGASTRELDVELSFTPVELAAGHTQACARSSRGEIACWPLPSPFGPGPRETVEAQAIEMSPAVSLRMGASFGCAETAERGLVCWGELGTPWLLLDAECVACEVTLSGRPVLRGPTELARGVEAIGVGPERVCAVVDGRALCWEGSNPGCSGSQERGPVRVPELDGARALALSAASICAIEEGGGVRCLLDQERGPATRADVRIETSAPARALWGGWGFTCAELVGGDRACWRLEELLPASWRE